MLKSLGGTLKIKEIQIEIRRHGEWDYMHDKLTGEFKVRELASILPQPDLVLCGTHRRVVDTAEILARGSPIKHNELLNEITELKRVEEKVKKILGLVIEEALTLQSERPKVLVVTSGRLLGALVSFLTRTKPQTLKELEIFNPLEGIEIEIEISLLRGK